MAASSSTDSLQSAPSDRELPPAKSTLPFFLSCALLLLVMSLIGVMAMRNPSHGPDFRSFYSAGYLVRTHPRALYDPVLQKQVQDTLVSPAGSSLPFYHPSYEALLYAPFSLLPYKAAYFAFIGFNILLIIATFLAARPLFSTPIPFVQSLPGLAFFLFAPLWIAIWHGQDSILFLLVCCLTFRQLQRHRDWSAGVMLALALFRFQLAIPIALLMTVQRGWKFLLGFLAGAVAVVAACVGIVGVAGTRALFRLLSASTLSADQRGVTQQVLGIYPRTMANLRGLLYACGTSKLPPSLAFGIVAALSAVVFVVCLLLIRRQRSAPTAFAIAIVCAILASYHLNFHDLTLLLLPLALLARRTHPAVLAACYYLPMVLLFCNRANWFFLLAIPTLALLVSAFQRPIPVIEPG
jgi:hypothetical protein